MEYEKKVDQLTSRTTGKDDITIDSVSEALDELDNPEEDCKVILVGGTNGKGSTVEMISELLQYQGKNVGSFKSPHLVTLRERIQLNSQKISKEEFMELYPKIDELEQKLSFFEFMTVMAYLYFSRKDVDYAVMEVGMGGRLDATNAAEPELSVITNIDLEHTQYLGNSREEIAEEKAGIIPEDGETVTREKLDAIKQAAIRKNSEIIRPVKLDSLEDERYRFEDQVFRIPVSGSFQQRNLENSLAAVGNLESIPEDMEEALSDLSCPGRMEKVSEEPEIILDGAHNPAALETAIQDLPESFTCVFNTIDTKDSDRMVQILEQKASRFVVTESGVEWSADPVELQKSCNITSEVVEDSRKAVRKAVEYGEPVVVTGSLYLIGELKNQDLNIKSKIRVDKN